LDTVARIEDTMFRLLSYPDVSPSHWARQSLTRSTIPTSSGQSHGWLCSRQRTGHSEARTVSAQLSLDLGQQFFVENRTGANGLLVLARVVQAKPDGYTILYSSNGIAADTVYL
jgi:hypothetical protein